MNALTLDPPCASRACAHDSLRDIELRGAVEGIAGGSSLAGEADGTILSNSGLASDFKFDSDPHRAAARISASRPVLWSGPITLSLFAHVLLAGLALAFVATGRLPLLHVEQGRASIALEASMVADAVERESQSPEEMTPLFLEFVPTQLATIAAGNEAAELIRRDEPISRPSAAPVRWAMSETALPTNSEESNVRLASVSRLALLPTASETQQHPTIRRATFKQTQRATLPIESMQASIASASALGTKTVPVPEIISNVAPRYPARALSAGLTGTVLIRVTIDDDGLVIAALSQRSSGVASLDAAAMEAIWLWRFSPAADSAGPARQVIVPIDFVLRD